ncbi:MAG: branched-chain amino acid ABC transporter permease [Chloroflexi bacterium]|nr:branched-chain amino acid ABC transporter permease [Chloroflexota bacterium]MBL7061161.1 branched-chain amino acid ABC transporter permease [Dehalococcoidia bacterium]
MTDVGTLVSPIIMGILLGGLYALIALGLSMVFGVMRLINLAHGDLVILGSYIAFACMTYLGMDPILSLVIAIPVLFGIGFFIQQFLMSRAFAISAEAPLIIAFGIALIIQNTNQIMWTPLSRGLTTAYSLSSFHLGSYQFPLSYLLNFIAAVVVMLALREFLRRTYLGKAITAASQDRRAAQLMGINTKMIYGFAFAIAMICAAIAGIFLGMTFPFTPTSGIQFLIIAFGVVIIGGLGSIFGTFLGGIILGLVQTLTGFFFGPATQMLFIYVIVLVILAIRPKGLLGR